MTTQTASSSPNDLYSLLEGLPTAEEHKKASILETLREYQGVSLERSASLESSTFDWQLFNAQFRLDHDGKSVQELLALARSFGFESLNDIKQKRYEQLDLRRLLPAERSTLVSDNGDMHNFELVDVMPLDSDLPPQGWDD